MASDQEEKVKAWAKELLEQTVQELMEKGVVSNLLVEAKPVWIIPYQLMIGKIREQGDASDFSWFIAGDMPTDHADSGVAATARDAAKNFALRGQLHAARNESSDDGLPEKAEALYKLTADDSLWSDN